MKKYSWQEVSIIFDSRGEMGKIKRGGKIESFKFISIIRSSSESESVKKRSSRDSFFEDILWTNLVSIDSITEKRCDRRENRKLRKGAFSSKTGNVRNVELQETS